MDPFVLLVLLFLCGAASAEDVISLRPGDDAILPCRSADPNIRAVEWTRDDLKSEYVFLYRDGHLQSENQHPSFQGRVQLVDLKDRNVSLTLKNVSSSDEGTYECRVVGGSRRQQRSIIKTEPISRVKLQVTGSDDAAVKGGGRTHMFIGLAAGGVLVCLSVGFFVFIKSRRRLNNEPEAAAADKAERVELTMLQS